ncbi:MAG TPA: hypothetical protein VHM70_29285 [Polyangiaceae bacterium]|jgi:hypothetical protein|nr:hypothetical protein [Polyangiaceae bacterium]
MNHFKLALISLFLLQPLLSCSVADEVENKITCSRVCNRYKDCLDSDYDVDGCTSSCEKETNNDEDKDRRLETCNDCITNRSCSEATFKCADECVGVIK